MRAPIGARVIVVTAKDCGAGHQEQHLAKGKAELGRLPRITDLAEVIHQQTQTILDDDSFHGGRLPYGDPIHCESHPIPQRYTATARVNLSKPL